MTSPRTRLAAVLAMTLAAATASSLGLVGTARADDTQSGAQSGTQSGSSWVPGTTIPLANAKSVEASSVSASTLTFASNTSEQTKIFVLSSGSSDAILIESGGWYGIIDGGEDADLPDGSDPRYPVRSGTAAATNTSTEWLLQYLDDQGVNETNVAFYLGTHAHSDHIDNADEIIRKFRPKVILSPEYSDEWITDKSRLWDNQWIYDNMMAAAQWAQGAYGASIVQNIHDYNTHITLGDMDVQIIPTDPAENYKRTGVRDANFIAYTAKVSAFGHSAYLAADLEAGGGYEDRIAPIVGHVDMLKAGHHGLPSSNTESFLSALSPSVIVQTGPEWYSPDRLTASVVDGTTVWAPMNQLWSSGHIPSLIATFAPSGISYNDISGASWGHEYGGRTPRAWWFAGGRPAAKTGWWKGTSGNWYYFAGKPSAEASAWINDGGQWYWMDATGAMMTGWIYDGKARYYLDSAGHPSGSGWSFIDGSWYYLSGGRVALGWLYDAGSWYYLDEQTGAMVTGWKQIGGTWYYLNSSGAMVTGWLNGGSAWYYLGGSGAMATGWLYDGGSWYYLDPTTGAMATGWVQVDGKWYYLRSSGALVTGWLNGGSSWYYLSGSGAMATGWILDHGAWYYMDETGAMVTGTREVDGRSSTFASSGRWVGYAS